LSADQDFTRPHTADIEFWSVQAAEGRRVSANVQFESEIRWDGNNLSIWATNCGARILCIIPRATIHEVPLFSDAITREIERDRAEIFNRLRPALVAKIGRLPIGPVELQPTDLAD
jgi:hypothetical protein